MSDGRPYDPNVLRRMTEAMSEARSGGGQYEFDGIIQERRALDRLADQERSRNIAENHERLNRLHNNLEGFVRRMQTASDPRTDRKVKVGIFRSVPAWGISITDAKSGHRRFTLTTDGRIETAPSRLVPVREWQPDLSEDQYQACMRNLAGIVEASGA